MIPHLEKSLVSLSVCFVVERFAPYIFKFSVICNKLDVTKKMYACVCAVTASGLCRTIAEQLQKRKRKLTD